MTTAASPGSARKFAGWVALIGAAMSALNIYGYIAATGGDLELMFRPAEALALSDQARNLFLLSQFADSFGYYLPYLVIGGYFWSRFRAVDGAWQDMAALCIAVYAMLGLVGTSMQFAALPVLSASHAVGDASVKLVTETVWLGLVHATQAGVWWMEGPVIAFWAYVVGTALRREGNSSAYALLLGGFGYAGYFLARAADLSELAGIFEPLAIFPLLAWQAWIGISLLREG